MEGMYGFSKKHSGVWRSLRDGDFEEEEVWAVLKEKKVYSPKVEQFSGSSSRVTTTAMRVPSTSAAKMIPKSASDNEAEGIRQQSAPLTISNWSKIPRKKSNNYDDDDDDDDDDDEYEFKIPPHEILARRFARSQISSFSVFEGVGRKLKGRDLCKVRNAVLTKTGFLE